MNRRASPISVSLQVLAATIDDFLRERAGEPVGFVLVLNASELRDVQSRHPHQ